MGDLGRYERMAQRARERAARNAPPPTTPRRWVLDHTEHETHLDLLFHGAAVMCSCGETVGGFSYAPPSPREWDEMVATAPDFCPACRANGIETPNPLRSAR